MKEFVDIIEKWQRESTPFAVATVIRTWGSSPRPVGSQMLIAQNGEIAGSVSGGCVEGFVSQEALDVLRTDKPKYLEYGVTDDDAWAVGLSCGGRIEIMVEPSPAHSADAPEREAFKMLFQSLKSNSSCIWITNYGPTHNRHYALVPGGTGAGSNMTDSVLTKGLEAFDHRAHMLLEEEGGRTFIQIFPGRSKMFIIGVAHITTHLISLAAQFDFETIVIDPRSFFTEKTQYITVPDQAFKEYPADVLRDFTIDAHTYAVILSHDPKIDDNALEVLLRSGVAYIGALGSKKTHAKRVARLREKGFSDEEIAKIHAPVGMDINAKTPQEIALAVMGEIIAVKNQYR